MTGEPQSERLQKVMARAGCGSRRVCEELIADGRVTVNGATAELGRRVDPDSDEVRVDGVTLPVRPGAVYYVLHKPAGVVSSAKDTHDRTTVVDLVPPEPRVFPVGRLDRDSEGLILLTNDGKLANLLTHPRHGVDKEYLVEVECADGGVPPRVLNRLRRGVDLDDGPTLPAQVSQPTPGVLSIVLQEGRNRQIRRMCDVVGHPVRRLVRVRIGSLRDSRLGSGRWRSLTQSEIRALYEVAEAPNR